MGVDRVVIEIVRITPDLVPQLRPRQHAFRIGRKDREEVELGHRERDLLLADLDAAGGVVDLQRTDAEHTFATAATFSKR